MKKLFTSESFFIMMKYQLAKTRRWRMITLCETFLIYHVPRYDVKGKELLKSSGKYYISDMGLRTFLLGGLGDEGRILENLVYLELLRRSRNVYIGKVGTYEVDFVTRDGDSVAYYQVALTVRTPETLERELNSLQKIKDNHPKYLITLDSAPEISHGGIRQIFALDWFVNTSMTGIRTAPAPGAGQ